MDNDAPGAYPEPPLDLGDRRLPFREMRNPTWYRGHRRGRDPLHFNRSAGRFAPPDGHSFGTLYAGEDEYAAFIEAFNQGVDSTPWGLFISASLLAQRCLCLVSAIRPLRVVDLTSGTALKHLSAGADSRIGDGPHAVSQRWAAALWAHPERPDGLIYRSRNAPDHRSIALFDRCVDALVANCAFNLLEDAFRFDAILEHFGCALIP